MCGGLCIEVAMLKPQLISVLRVAMRAMEKIQREKADGLKICVRRPSRFHLINSLPNMPVAIRANCKKNQSSLNQRNRLVLMTMGTGPKPKTQLSRRDQHTSMSRA